MHDYLLKSLTKGKTVKVDAYLFAAANVGDAGFVAGFNSLVNARR